MKITEVRIFPTESKDGKLKAFATMTFDDWFVVRNVKVIQGNNGLFVAMPSRKAMESCPKCRFKNVTGSKYCNQCGEHLPPVQPSAENNGEKHGNHMDIAHPITQDCRIYIQEQILAAYNGEKDNQPAKDVSDTPEAASEVTVGPSDTVVPPEEVLEDIKDLEDTKDIEL